MAASFPIAMPTKGAAGQVFEVQRIDYSSSAAGGALGGVQAGFPRWMATWDLGRMGQDASDAWRAFHLMMRGGQRRFYGRDLSRPLPKAHLGGLPGGFSGSASSWSETLDSEENSRVTLNGVAAGLILSIGDYIGFKWDASGFSAGNYKRRALVRVVEAGVASGGGSVTVTSEPPVPAVVPSGAIAHLDMPVCVMGFLPEAQLSAMNRSLAVGGKIVAIEDLRP
jgi:hypothetical protein